MSRFLYILVFSFLAVTSFSAVEINPEFQQVTNQITDAISKGDAAAVAKFFDTSVDITILDTSGTYSKSQAEQMLKNFFTRNRVQKFEVEHNISSPSNRSNAFVGWLTANGKRYRLFVQMADSGSKKIVQEISIKER